MVSPYLNRPVRSLDEVLRGHPADSDLVTTIRRVVQQAKTAGQGQHEQLNRAAMLVLQARPELSPLDALALVQKATKSKKKH